MPLQPSWPDIAIRLLCAVVAGCVFGFNRSEHGRAAGLRTTTLVSLAACLSMVEVNLLLPLAGKTPGSFITMDLMRLPLGILSGMGFIGAGAIIRREQLIIGVTTAATMWFVTVIGLCFGGGQIVLGLAATVIGTALLSGLKLVEERIEQDHQGSLLIESGADGPGEAAIRGMLKGNGIKIVSCAVASQPATNSREFKFELLWRSVAGVTTTPGVVDSLADLPGVIRLAWTPVTK